MTVRFLVVRDDVVRNILIAESEECLSGYPGSVLQTDDLADVRIGWKRGEDGIFSDPYYVPIDEADPEVTA